MRTFDDIRTRWLSFFDSAFGVDLRQAVRDESGPDPCEEGLRSVCWRAFMLYGPLSNASWTKKLSESRSAYASLRDHFLKYIDHPNDLHSSTDPLADDDTSPWSTLRQDETSREEIFQDVTRCMQDNYFFREPTTQRKLLDILFIYSKLNPDTGYRQGMHELLAPILWVIEQDAIDVKLVPKSARSRDDMEFMLDLLDKKYVEHDAFNLFCAVMQTAKGFYEMGDSKDSSAIIAQSERIHKDFLAAVDPDLAHHLQVVGILPQIYSIRWIRLLFGREFDFKNVLKMWDLLFAESLALEVVDMTCVAMLLRLHWRLIEADYTIAITTLTRFDTPNAQNDPRSLVRDAVYLRRNRTPEAGAEIIGRHSGRKPDVAPRPDQSLLGTSPAQPKAHLRNRSHQASPSHSPARFSTPQKQLETIFQDVSGTLQRRTEGWSVQSVSKALRGAVGEVRRNVNNMQTANPRGSSFDVARIAAGDSSVGEVEALKHRIDSLETRNKALARMLDNALQELRASKDRSKGTTIETDDTFNMSLAKIQFVSVYLSDAEIPIPQASHEAEEPRPVNPASVTTTDVSATASSQSTKAASSTDESDAKPTKDKIESSAAPVVVLDEGSKPLTRLSTGGSQNVRPSLADSSFSFMLGENRHRSSFVSSVTELPEQRRGSDSKARPNQLWVEQKDKKEKKDKKDKKDRKDRKDKDKNPRKGSESGDDGFTMSSLTGGQR